VSEFGDAIVDSESGEIDRKALGGIVFGHDADMKRLTNIVWPCIRSLLREEIERLSREGVDVCVVEAAVLFEAGWDDIVDEVWMVCVPPDVAIERLAKRNGIAVEDAQKRINSQWSNNERIHKAHVIISNEWDEITTRMQVTCSTPPPAALSSFSPPSLSFSLSPVSFSVPYPLPTFPSPYSLVPLAVSFSVFLSVSLSPPSPVTILSSFPLCLSPSSHLPLSLFSRPSLSVFPVLSVVVPTKYPPQHPTRTRLRSTSTTEIRALVHFDLTWPCSLGLMRDLSRLKRLGST
jgi:dephospho-CoA kinase